MQTPRVFLAALCLSALAYSQEFRATISGHVFDGSGASVAGAKIIAVSKATNETSNATSDGSGTYSIPFLRPGEYRVTVTAAGFKTYNREGLTLQVGQIVGMDATLEVGALTESVNVVADAAMLETQSASRIGVVNTMQVAELPLNARNPFMLGTMMSGVVFRGAAIWQRPFDNGAIAQWSVNGGRESNNEFMMDGAPNNAQAGGNNIAYVPIVDAVQEFNVQQNSYDAQYGKTGGGVFNVVLKSGTNTHHFTAWEFARRKFLDANTFQGNAIPQPSGVKNQRANHVLDQYGFQLEGPVTIPKLLRKDGPVRLFYLGSFENYREATPNPLRNSYPELEMRNGDFSKMRNETGVPVVIYNPFSSTPDAAGDPVRLPFPGNVIPGSMISPVAKAVTAFMPTPNAATPGNLRYGTTNYQLPAYVNNDKFYNLILKFDWNFGDKHRAYFRHASNDRTEDRAVNGIDNKPGTDGQQPFQRINDAYVADWLYTAAPTLIFNVRASSNRFIEKGFGRANEGFNLSSLGLPASLLSQIPGGAYFGRWNSQGYASLGRSQSNNFTNNYNLFANVTKIAGAHTLKMGMDLRRIHFIQQNTGDILSFSGNRDFTQQRWNQGDATTGDGYASFLIGAVGGSSNYPLFPFFQQWYFSPYIQDDWKVSRKLTLNMGLRWDFNGSPTEKYDRINRGFDPSTTSPILSQIPADLRNVTPAVAALKGGFRFAGVNGAPHQVSDNYKRTLQPRIGAAYQLSEKAVLRGGYGLYYLNPTNAYLQTAGFSTSTPLVNSLDGGRTPLPNLLSNPYPTGVSSPAGASAGLNTFVGRNNDWFDPKFRVPKYHSFSLGVQYQTSRSSTLEVSYVGSRSVDLNNSRAFNIPTLDFRKQCNPLEGGSVAFCDAQLPNPFKGLPAFANTGYSTANTISRYNLNRPYPQFTGDLTRQGDNNAKAWYNSMQINYNQRIANSLTLLTNYTLSKTMELSGYNDPFANVAQQGLYFNDRPHFFKFTAVYELPMGKGKFIGSNSTGFVNKLISGWEMTSFFTTASGEPADLPGNVIQVKDPKIQNVDWKANKVQGFNPCTQRINNNGSLTYNNCGNAAGVTPAASDIFWIHLPSYAPRATPFRSGQIRKHRAYSLDASLNKSTQITERIRVQFRFEAFNLMNHNYFGRDTFNTDPASPNFGSVFPALVSNQNTFPRQLQLGVKFYY